MRFTPPSTADDSGYGQRGQENHVHAVWEGLARSKEYNAQSFVLANLVNGSLSYTPTQIFEAKQLSVDLLDKPEDFYMHNRRYSASVIMQVIYGRRIPKCINPTHQ